MFSEIYDKIITLSKDLLPDYKELVHPYDLLVFNKWDNIQKGFGIVVGSGTIDDFLNLRSVTRTLTFAFTRKFYTANYTPEFRQTKEKELITDAYTFADDFNTRTKICGLLNYAKPLSDSGIEFEDENKIITLSIDIEINYKEV